MSRCTNISLDASALAHNLAVLQAHAPESQLMAAIKANAYGHGAVWASKVLMDAGADALAVCSINEAMELREYDIKSPIVLLEGMFDIEEIAAVSAEQFTCFVHQEYQIEFLEKSNLNNEINNDINVVIKVDTGMGRLGIHPTEFPTVLARLTAVPTVSVIGVATHFANADMPDHVLNQLQINQFEALADAAKYPRTAANSAAIFSQPQAHYDWIRPGIALYGASPIQGETAKTLDLQAVMTFSACIISIKQLDVGDSIGYGSTWTCERKTTVAVVSAGYGDGYPRHAKQGTPVWLNGQHTRLIGRVSMDMLTIDVTDLVANIGDKVELWGRHVPANTVASFADTIPYALFCGICNRVKRVYR